MAEEKKEEAKQEVKKEVKPEAAKPAEPKAETAPVAPAAAEAAKPAEEKKEPKKEKPANCAGCNKSIKKKRWYYRDGKFYCSKRCWQTAVEKEKEKREDGREPTSRCLKKTCHNMQKEQFPPTEALYPVPVVLVSSVDKTTRKANIITIAWCGIVSSLPPHLTISIRPSRYSHKLIQETGDFVVNVPRVSMLNKVDLCGVRSGREIDKFEACGFTELPSSKVLSPYIGECPVNIECKLKQVIKLGAHDMFIGEVMLIHADGDILKPDKKIDYLKADPIIFTQGEYWSLGKRIGTYGFSAK